MKTPKFRILESHYFQHKVPLVALDYYDQHSHGEDDFSRKQVWFYTYGDEEIEKEFRDGMMEIFEDLFENDDLDWDLMTLYPTHVQGEVNSHLQSLFMEISGEMDIPMEQVLERTETVRENHVVPGEKSKVVNLEGSVAVNQDLEGKNIILIDNIAISGVSMLHGANLLKKNGAENVFAVVLGTDKDFESQTTEIKNGEKASDLLAKTENGG